MVVFGGARVDKQQFILKNFFFSSRKPILFVYNIYILYIYKYILCTTARAQWKNVVFYFRFKVSRPTLYTSSGLMAERIIFHLK